MKFTVVCLAVVGLFAVGLAASVREKESQSLIKLVEFLENKLESKQNTPTGEVESREIKDTEEEAQESGTTQVINIDPTKKAFYSWSSTNYPFGYTETYISQSFALNIHGYTDYSLSVTFTDFDIEPPGPDGVCNDKVLVQDGESFGAPIIGEFCGKMEPFTVYSSGQYIFVNFLKVQNGITGKGFACDFNYLRITDIPANANQFGSPVGAPAPAPTPAPSVPAGGNSGPDADGVYIITEGVRDSCLYSHNAVRALHQSTSAMTYDASMEPAAQEYARYLARTNLFEHDNARGNVGENLYKRWSWGDGAADTPARATFAWYEERHDYSFSTGLSTGGMIGHFTQIVWQDTERVACGVAKIFRDGFTETIIVARYAPPGNYVGMNTIKVKNYKSGANFPSKWQDIEY